MIALLSYLGDLEKARIMYGEAMLSPAHSISPLRSHGKMADFRQERIKVAKPISSCRVTNVLTTYDPFNASSIPGIRR